MLQQSHRHEQRRLPIDRDARIKCASNRPAIGHVAQKLFPRWELRSICSFAKTSGKADHVAPFFAINPAIPITKINFTQIFFNFGCDLKYLCKSCGSLMRTSKNSDVDRGNRKGFSSAPPLQRLVVLHFDEALDLHDHLSFKSAQHQQRPDFLHAGITKDQQHL